MTDRFDLYDILGSLTLGALAICWVPICFPDLLDIRAPEFPEAFSVFALVALSWFTGQLMQAIASLLEPALFWTYGGRHSERALTVGLGDRYLPVDSTTRIRAKLEAIVGAGASDGSLFQYAMHRSDAAGVGRAARFNSIYAYHRGVLILVLFATVALLASTKWGAAADWPVGLRWGVLLIALLLLVLLWHRTKQRSMYYVREVLFTAERVLDEKATPGGGATS